MQTVLCFMDIVATLLRVGVIPLTVGENTFNKYIKVLYSENWFYIT